MPASLLPCNISHQARRQQLRAGSREAGMIRAWQQVQHQPAGQSWPPGHPRAPSLAQSSHPPHGGSRGPALPCACSAVSCCGCLSAAAARAAHLVCPTPQNAAVQGRQQARQLPGRGSTQVEPDPARVAGIHAMCCRASFLCVVLANCTGASTQQLHTWDKTCVPCASLSKLTPTQHTCQPATRCQKRNIMCT